ncbi:hypothetical protein [Streptomyces purpurogeneiscleroticus]|uniref:hypothetical protein n=1 Tax=Streptomyces purpurogeneiscleroticus TaxID=68259 RepID=UPI001CBB8896|nr:hypothetical protein [Streptomyces purpurogeneiscleroticus]
MNETLRDLLKVDGVLGVSVVDYYSRLLLGAIGHPAGPDLEKAALVDTDVVRAKLSALETLGYRPDRMEDILITLDDEYHLIRPLSRCGNDGIFFYVVLDRSCADLLATRQLLRAAEEGFDV